MGEVVSYTKDGIDDLVATAVAEISTTIANLIASAPDALNTLNELAAALGDDENFAATVAAELASKATVEQVTNEVEDRVEAIEALSVELDSTVRGNTKVVVSDDAPPDPQTNDLWVDVGGTPSEENLYDIFGSAASEATRAQAAEAAETAARQAADLLLAPKENPVFTGVATAPAMKISGITGAVSPTRYVGATASGPPSTGDFLAGDFVVTLLGRLWICTEAGSPGTWVVCNSAEIMIYSATGAFTWTKPVWAGLVIAHVVAAGGGGGSGARGAAGTVRTGGGGGGSGAYSMGIFAASVLGATVVGSVGAGGAGGAAQTVDSTPGNAGSIGAASWFGPSSSTALVGSGAGAGGAAGGTGAATGGTAGIGMFGGNTGGASSGTGAGGANAGIGAGAGPGGAGGGITSGNAPSTGGNGAASSQRRGNTAPQGGAIDTAGGTPSAPLTPAVWLGAGGGGGGASIVGAGGAGGAGANGGGGGGGGASLNGNVSGAGGAGGNGVVIVISQP